VNKAQLVLQEMLVLQVLVLLVLRDQLEILVLLVPKEMQVQLA
jgi:hypothetical protein